MGTKPGLWLHGSSGRMGREIQKALLETKSHFRLIGGSDRRFEGEQFHQGRVVTTELLSHCLGKDDVEVILDFSTPEANQLLLDSFAHGSVKGKAVVIGTTGLPSAQLDAWRKTAKELGLKLLIAPNTSVGILMTLQAALLVAAPLVKIGFDIELTETHHRLKKDAPSGTAKFLADNVALATDLKVTTDRHGERQANELGVHAVRGGGVFGEHEIRMISNDEEICISHRAFSRTLFASGALVLAGWAVKQRGGVYGLLDIKMDELI